MPSTWVQVCSVGCRCETENAQGDFQARPRAYFGRPAAVPPRMYATRRLGVVYSHDG